MNELDPAFGRDIGPGPWEWVVIWGEIGRPGVATVRIEAFDADEALTRATEQFPRRPQPRVALLARQSEA